MTFVLMNDDDDVTSLPPSFAATRAAAPSSSGSYIPTAAANPAPVARGFGSIGGGGTNTSNSTNNNTSNTSTDSSQGATTSNSNNSNFTISGSENIMGELPLPHTLLQDEPLDHGRTAPGHLQYSHSHHPLLIHSESNLSFSLDDDNLVIVDSSADSLMMPQPPPLPTPQPVTEQQAKTNYPPTTQPFSALTAVSSSSIASSSSSKEYNSGLSRIMSLVNDSVARSDMPPTLSKSNNRSQLPQSTINTTINTTAATTTTATAAKTATRSTTQNASSTTRVINSTTTTAAATHRDNRSTSPRPKTPPSPTRAQTTSPKQPQQHPPSIVVLQPSLSPIVEPSAITDVIEAVTEQGHAVKALQQAVSDMDQQSPRRKPTTATATEMSRENPSSSSFMMSPHASYREGAHQFPAQEKKKSKPTATTTTSVLHPHESWDESAIHATTSGGEISSSQSSSADMAYLRHAIFALQTQQTQLQAENKQLAAALHLTTTKDPMMATAGSGGSPVVPPARGSKKGGGGLTSYNSNASPFHSSHFPGQQPNFAPPTLGAAETLLVKKLVDRIDILERRVNHLESANRDSSGKKVKEVLPTATSPSDQQLFNRIAALESTIVDLQSSLREVRAQSNKSEPNGFSSSTMKNAQTVVGVGLQSHQQHSAAAPAAPPPPLDTHTLSATSISWLMQSIQSAQTTLDQHESLIYQQSRRTDEIHDITRHLRRDLDGTVQSVDAIEANVVGPALGRLRVVEESVESLRSGQDAVWAHVRNLGGTAAAAAAFGTATGGSGDGYSTGLTGESAGNNNPETEATRRLVQRMESQVTGISSRLGRKVDTAVLEGLMRHLATRDELRKLAEKLQQKWSLNNHTHTQSDAANRFSSSNKMDQNDITVLERRILDQLDHKLSLISSQHDRALEKALSAIEQSKKSAAAEHQRQQRSAEKENDLTALDDNSNTAELVPIVADHVLRKITREFDEKLYLLCADLSACKTAFEQAARQPFYRCGHWLWRSGGLKHESAVPWNFEAVNTDPQNFGWVADQAHIRVAEAGLYEITFGFFTKARPSIQLVVNGESVLSAIHSPSYVVHHPSGFVTNGLGQLESGSITGTSLIDFVMIPAKSSVALHYHCAKKSALGHGFIGLRRVA